jgi:hypothetical protein
MKVGILDVDSTIPNLALMKLSAWHRAQGDEVEFYIPLLVDSYDKIYASKIFDFSDGSGLIPDRMEIGGTGYDMRKTLPVEIENGDPDYSLYRYPHSIGFTQRGCRLKCKFCVVPQKEGTPYSTHTIEKIWTQRNSNFIVLLDNDFFGNPEWRDRIEEIRCLKLRVNFSQGLNIRNLTEEQAAALAGVQFRTLSNLSRQVYFAWDDVRHEKLIHRGIKRCVDAGIKPRQMAFYVLVGYNSEPDEDMHRVEVLRGYGVDPFVMPYKRTDPYQRRFARWVNHKAIFNSVSWRDYVDFKRLRNHAGGNQWAHN